MIKYCKFSIRHLINHSYHPGWLMMSLYVSFIVPASPCSWENRKQLIIIRQERGGIMANYCFDDVLYLAREQQLYR